MSGYMGVKVSLVALWMMWASVADSNVRFRGSTTFTDNSAGFGGVVGIEFGASANVSLSGTNTFTGN